MNESGNRKSTEKWVQISTSTTSPSSNTKRKEVLVSPEAEMHILVGGPYRDANGEIHRYGHTSLRIKTKKSDKTYDFGRYGNVSGAFGERGDGILRVWSNFDYYIKGENALKRLTTAFVYKIFNYQAEDVNAYFLSLTSAGQHLENKSSLIKKVYKLPIDYHALGPNCTTLTIDGAKKAIPKIDDGANKFNRPEDVLSLSERVALLAKGGSDRLFLPANLEKFLRSSETKSSRIDTYGSEK